MNFFYKSRLTATVQVKDSPALKITIWKIFNQVVFKHLADVVDRDVIADLFVLQLELEIFLHFLECTFRVKLAGSQECQEKRQLRWKRQIFLGCKNIDGWLLAYQIRRLSGLFHDRHLASNWRALFRLPMNLLPVSRRRKRMEYFARFLECSNYVCGGNLYYESGY